MCTWGRCTHKLYINVLLSQHVVIQFQGRNVNIVKNGRNMFLHSSLLKIWDFFHLCEKFYVFSHSWKKSQIFNRGLCKNVLFLYTCQTSRHGILEGCRALLPLVPYPKRPHAFFGSFKKLVLKLPFSCQKYRSMCMICQLTDYITKFDTCCMV